MPGSSILCLFLISVLLLPQWGAKSYADDSSRSGPEYLINKYHKIEKELEKSSGSVPFYVESSVNNNSSHVDIYGTVKTPFDIVQKELLIPVNWCRIVLSHPDIRACTYKKANDTWLLNVYHVDKFSDPFESAYQMNFVYRVSALQPEYFDVALTAHEGPSSTKNHHFGLEAIPLENNRTLIHLRYSFRYSALVYFFMKILGGTKTGFSVIGTDSDGKPIYAEGLRGSAERDVVCHYLAILAYLETLEAPSDQRFERRISRWYDLSARFKKQFYEMKKGEYLKYKSQDRESQQRLQSDLGT
jgi:hypothetical protein